jgi:hypothetical protein
MNADESPSTVPLVDAHFHLDLLPDPAAIAREIEAAQIHTIAVTNSPSVFFHTRTLAKGRRFLHPAVGLCQGTGTFTQLVDTNFYAENRSLRTIRSNCGLLPVPPGRGFRSFLPAADFLLFLPVFRFLAFFAPRATFSLPGETEAGSAGAQPDQGITRPTVRQGCILHAAPDHVAGPGAYFFLHPTLDTGAHASENAAGLPPEVRLPASQLT